MASLTGPRELVNPCVFSPDGKRIAVPSTDHFTEVWDVATWEKVAELIDSNGKAKPCVYSPDGTLIATISSDNSVWCWDAETGKDLKIMKCHNHWVNTCTFSPDGKRMATTSYDKTIKVWNTATGRLELTLEGHTNIVYSAVFSPDGGYIISISEDRTVRIWNSYNSELRGLFFTGYTPSCLSLSGNSRWLALGDSDGNVYILKIGNISFGAPYIVPVRLYLHNAKNWDSAITASCSSCGARFKIAEDIIERIRLPNCEKGLGNQIINDKSSVLCDSTNLLYTCPSCRKPFQFTPFIVDNIERYSISTEKKPWWKIW